MNSKKIIFMLLIVLACLTGCRSNSNKESMKTDNTPTTEYVYITYTLDKEYKIGLDENFSAKDIGQFDEKFRDVNLIELTKYIIEDNKQYLESNNTMTVYVDTDKVSYYSQCIVQIASLINSSYPSYKVEYLNLPKGTIDDNTDNKEKPNPTENNNNNSSNNTNTQSGSSTDTSSGTNNSNSGEKQMILPTISYVCSKGYELKEGKCVKETIYNATKQPTCLDGYNYNESKKKCIQEIKREPSVVEDCRFGERIGNKCVEKTKLSTTDAVATARMEGGCFPPGYKECLIHSYEDREFDSDSPELVCPEGTVIENYSLHNSVSCYADGYEFEPISVKCKNSSDILHEDSQKYYCTRIETITYYMFYYCMGAEQVLEGDKCVTYDVKEEDVIYGMYCNEDSGEEMINGKCVSYQEQAPTIKYQCNSGDKNYNTSQCIHVDSVATTPKYSCPNKYVLTVEYMCIER